MASNIGNPAVKSELPAQATCWRCGVTFDPREYINGAPCADCQYEDAPGEWLRADTVRNREYDRINRLVQRFYDQRFSDAEIGAAIGMDHKGVQRRRLKLGLPAHKFYGSEKWRNPESVVQNLRDNAQEQVRNPKSALGKGRFYKVEDTK